MTGITRPRVLTGEGSVEIIALPTSYNFAKWLAFQLINVPSSLAFTAGFRPGVVHVFGMVTPSSALSATLFRLIAKLKLLRLKLFLDWDDLWSEGSQGILRDYNFLIRTIGHLFEHRTLSLGDGVTVVSEYLESKARILTRKEIFRVPNGCDTDNVSFIGKTEARAELGLPFDAPVLVHVGFTDLTHMFNIVSMAYPQAMLVIVGRAPRFISLRISKLQRTVGITYTGPVSQAQVRKYLAAADILVLKQENEATEMARWPIRFGDYLVAGRPIVTGSLGEVGRIMSEGKCGLTAKPGDQTDLARCIINLLENAEARDEFGENAASMARELAWPNIAQNLSAIYARLSP
jgi:glycosyltransferase involved in cell wall biosynthesis